MTKKIFSAMLILSLLAGIIGLNASADTFTVATSFWPMYSAEGTWYCEEYSSSNYIYNNIYSSSPKALNIDTENGALRASLSGYAQRQDAFISFVFQNGGEIIDLSADNYLYYDFTMQNVSWKLSLTLGIDGNNSYDVTIPLQKLICETSGTANLTDNSQYGVSGVYRGRIDLNKAIEESGNNLFYDIDLVGKKVHITNGNMSYVKMTANDVMEIRSLEMGRGEKDFPILSSTTLSKVNYTYETKDIEMSENFCEGETVYDFINSGESWKVSVGENKLGPKTYSKRYINITDTAEGIAVQPTGRSANTTEYAKNNTIGWPKAQYTCDTVNFFADGTYLIYDLEAQTGWDVLLDFDGKYISLADVINNTTKENILADVTAHDGVRARGSAGSYKGCIDLFEVLNFYTAILNTNMNPAKNAGLTGIVIIYENTESNATDLVNKFNALRIVREAGGTDASTVNDVTELKSGVYKPEKESESLTEELKYLYELYSPIGEGSYTSESYQKLQIALANGKQLLDAGVETQLDINGEWRYYEPKSGEYLNSGDFNSKQPLYILQKPVNFSSGTDSYGRDYNKISYNKYAIGLYTDNSTWGNVRVQYALNEPVTVNLAEDVINLDIKCSADEGKNITGTVWLVFENAGLYECALPLIRRLDPLYAETEYSLKLSKYISTFSDEFKEYLERNDYKDRLLGVIYQNDTACELTSGSCPNPAVTVYGISVDGNYLLSDAIAEIEYTVGFAETENIYNRYISESADKYTPKSYAALKQALDRAGELLELPYEADNPIDFSDIRAELESAIEGLELYGDVNADGKCDSTDIITLRKHLLKICVTVAPDVNQNGIANIMDLVALKKHLVKHSDL